jgi:hypothetical protein
VIQGSIPGRGKRFLSSPKCPDWLWGPSSLLFSRYQGCSLGVKQPKELSCWLTSSNGWSCTCTLPVCFCVMHRDNFSYLTFTLHVLQAYCMAFPTWQCLIRDLTSGVFVLTCMTFAVHSIFLEHWILQWTRKILCMNKIVKWRFVAYGMWCYMVCHTAQNFSEESAASVFRIEEKIPPKHWSPPAKLHDITSQKTITLIHNTVENSCLIWVLYFLQYGFQQPSQMICDELNYIA